MSAAGVWKSAADELIVKSSRKVPCVAVTPTLSFLIGLFDWNSLLASERGGDYRHTAAKWDVLPGWPLKGTTGYKSQEEMHVKDKTRFVCKQYGCMWLWYCKLSRLSLKYVNSAYKYSQDGFGVSHLTKCVIWVVTYLHTLLMERISARPPLVLDLHFSHRLYIVRA